MQRSRVTALVFATAAVGTFVGAAATAGAQTASPARQTSVDTAIIIRIAPVSPRARSLSRERLDSLRHVLTLLDSQVVGSPAWAQLQSQVTSLMSDLRGQMPGSILLAPRAGDLLPTEIAPEPPSMNVAPPRGWIGLSLDGPHDVAITPDGEAVHYFDYPLIVSVDPNSPADRSGIARGDQLLAYDGADVRQNWVNMGRLLEPDRRIRVTVKRDGQTRQYNVKVDSAPMFRRRVPLARLRVPMGGAAAQLALPTMLAPAPDALFGAVLSNVTPELGKALSVPAGVLVNGAPAESPAYASGLRTGDIVTSADGHSVASVAELRRVVLEHMGERQVTLELRRKNAKRRITLRW